MNHDETKMLDRIQEKDETKIVTVDMMDRNFDNFLYKRLLRELVNAAGAGNLKEVKRIVKEYKTKADQVNLLINSNDELLGRTALHAAADHGKLKVIVYLIKLGAKQLDIRNQRTFI